MININKMNHLLQVDKQKCQVTVEAGMTLHRLHAVLQENGLALSNLGSISDQTVAGVMATATHGTGAKFGCLSTMVSQPTHFKNKVCSTKFVFFYADRGHDAYHSARWDRFLLAQASSRSVCRCALQSGCPGHRDPYFTSSGTSFSAWSHSKAIQVSWRIKRIGSSNSFGWTCPYLVDASYGRLRCMARQSNR